MKAVLKFDLSIPEDLDDFRAACKAVEMAAVLWQLTHNAAKRLMFVQLGIRNLCTVKIVLT